MRNVRLVANLTINDDSTFTLSNVKVISVNEGAQTRLEGYKTLESNYGNVTALFGELQTTAVAIATSSLI